uniref:Transposase Tc1-like domain-containing protein n=1 Tax=Astyanax mexicanus TaxID=7994 RepID=A0A3B1K7I9_ASTMX
MDRRIAKLVKAQPMISSQEGIKERTLQLTVSTGTIRSRLGEINLPARSPRKVPLLNKRHVQKRLEFAKNTLSGPRRNGVNILWTDESKVLLFGQHIHINLIR